MKTYRISYVQNSLRIYDSFGALGIFELMINNKSRLFYGDIIRRSCSEIYIVCHGELHEDIGLGQEITHEYIEDFSYNELQEHIQKYIKFMGHVV